MFAVRQLVPHPHAYAEKARPRNRGRIIPGESSPTSFGEEQDSSLRQFPHCGGSAKLVRVHGSIAHGNGTPPCWRHNHSGRTYDIPSARNDGAPPGGARRTADGALPAAAPPFDFACSTAHSQGCTRRPCTRSTPCDKAWPTGMMSGSLLGTGGTSSPQSAYGPKNSGSCTRSTRLLSPPSTYAADWTGISRTWPSSGFSHSLFQSAPNERGRASDLQVILRRHPVKVETGTNFTVGTLQFDSS